MTLAAALLGLAGCLKVDAVPVANRDQGANDQGWIEDSTTQDPTANWPPLVFDGQREILEIYPCAEALVWTVLATRDALGNQRNDAEVWAWTVGGSPQVLAANLRPLFRRLAGCHHGDAYWNETDGTASSVHRRALTAEAPAEFVRSGAYWTMGDEGRLTRWLEGDVGVEIFDVHDLSVATYALDGLATSTSMRQTRATSDHLYVTGAPGGRIALQAGAGSEWVAAWGLSGDYELSPIPRRVVSTEAGGSTSYVRYPVVGEPALVLAQSCDALHVGAGPIPTVSARGEWLVWSFASSPGAGCSDVGRSALDENGNVLVQPLSEASQWVEEMTDGSAASSLAPIRVVQFGKQLAFFDLPRGTIRLADEPPFPCIDTILPCPPGAECATTRCGDLPN